MSKLNKIQIKEILKAVEMIASKEEVWSCNAIEKTAGLNMRIRYAEFYNMGHIWPELNFHATDEQTMQRTLLLLLFVEADL